MGEAPKDGMEFEPDDGEGDKDDEGGTTSEEDVQVCPFRPRRRPQVNDDNPIKEAEKCP